MTAQGAASHDVIWRLHLTSAPDEVYRVLSTDEGRAAFWAESAVEVDGEVHFAFINGERYAGRILGKNPPSFWSVDYFGWPVEFRISPDGSGGTDLEMRHLGLNQEARDQVSPGWLNVLLPMKAWVDHGIDLHNHDPSRSWDQRYVDH